MHRCYILSWWRGVRGHLPFFKQNGFGKLIMFRIHICTKYFTVVDTYTLLKYLTIYATWSRQVNFLEMMVKLVTGHWNSKLFHRKKVPYLNVIDPTMQYVYCLLRDGREGSIQYFSLMTKFIFFLFHANMIATNWHCPLELNTEHWNWHLGSKTEH